MRRILLAVLALTITSPASAQQMQQPAPKTQLEAFTGQTGTVLIKGYTEIGAIVAAGRAVVEAISLRNPQTAATKQGIVIEIHNSTGTLDRQNRSFVDYEEIDGLLKGIDYVSKATDDVSKLKLFEATYSTKGDLKVTVFDNLQRARSAVIESGSIGPVSVYLTLDQLQAFRTLITKAKDTLDQSGN